MYDIDLNLMRKSGRILAETLKFLTEEYIRPGITALDVSSKTNDFIRSYEGAIPAFIGYNGFPGALCVSVNDQVVHGIPGSIVFKEGDIVSVDCGVLIEEHYSDAARTIGIGEIEPKLMDLLQVTQRSLDLGIAQAVAGKHVSDISYAIQKHVESNGFKASLEFVGHGIGKVLHGPPCVPNYGPPGKGPILTPGTCLAIEPVVFNGPTDSVLKNDGWTIVSKNGNMSAHFEDTIIVTVAGPEVLTR